MTDQNRKEKKIAGKEVFASDDSLASAVSRGDDTMVKWMKDAATKNGKIIRIM
jgi:hypothetical protein